MKKITFLIGAIFFIFIGQIAAQVTIGTGTTEDQGLPIEPSSTYSYSQVIYLQSEIGAAMDIATLVYPVSAATYINDSNDWVIYMGHTTKTQFDSTTDWIDVANMIQVFSGVIDVNGGSVSVSLDTPFSYNGTDNLVIAIDENTAGADGMDDDFLCSSVTNPRGITFLGDYQNNPDPASPPTASYLRNYIANVTLQPVPDCQTPENINVVSFNNTSASVTWNDANDPPPAYWDYELVDLTEGESATGTPNGNFESNNATLSNLVPHHNYQIYIRSVCQINNVSVSDWSSAYEWLQLYDGDTCQAPIQAVINTDCNNESAVKFNLDFSQALSQGVMSCSNGDEVYGYWFEITITNTISLRINNNATGTNVGMSVSMDCSGSSEIVCEMVDQQVNVTDIDPGTYHALFWSTTQSGSTDLCFEEVPCMEPQDLGAGYIGYNSANFYWDAPSGKPVEWEVVETGQTNVIDSGTTTNDNTNVTNLTPLTDYTFRVRTDCGAGLYSDWSELNFTTTLENDLPQNALPLTIDRGADCGPNMITGISNAGSTDSGIPAPSCGSYGNPTERGDLWYVFDAPYETVTLNVSNVNGMTSVAGALYIESGGNYTEIGCTEFSSGWPWEITGLNHGYTYFLRVWDYGNDQDGTFDLCGYYESCEAPTDLTVLNVTNHEVTFSWTENAGATQWYYDIRPNGDPAPSGSDMGIYTMDNPAHDTGLNSDTAYDLYVRSDCGDGNYSLWVGITFTTTTDEAADWCNLQWPPNGTSEIGTDYSVYAQIYEPGLTDADSSAPGNGILAWIGYSDTDTDPATWTNWIPATYNLDSGNNDEFMANVGPSLPVGSYYLASRFKINDGYYTYGGINGPWDHDSATLTITPIANDACDGAVIVDTLPYNITQDATYDTNNDGYITPSGCGSGMNDGVWYTFTVTTGGDITVTANPTGWDVEIAVYTGSCGAFTCVDNSDSGYDGDAESITFTAVAGTQYWVNIGSWSANHDYAEGVFELDITSPDAELLGIANSVLEGFVMYPNPVADILYLKARQAIDNISIYNMLGQEILTNSPAATQVQLDMSTLPVGTYIVKVQAGNKLGSYNLIKQ